MRSCAEVECCLTSEHRTHFASKHSAIPPENWFPSSVFSTRRARSANSPTWGKPATVHTSKGPFAWNNGHLFDSVWASHVENSRVGYIWAGIQTMRPSCSSSWTTIPLPPEAGRSRSKQTSIEEFQPDDELIFPQFCCLSPKARSLSRKLRRKLLHPRQIFPLACGDQCRRGGQCQMAINT